MSELFSVKGKNVLITGCPRSGTHYIATVLRKLGLDVGHECIRHDGVVDCRATFGWYDNYEFEHVFHQVRNPLVVISSLSVQGNLLGAFVPPKILEFIAKEKKIESYRNLTARQANMHLWLYSTEMAEEMAEWTYRIESISSAFVKICDILGIEYNDETIKIMKSVPPDLTTFVNFQGYGPISFDILQRSDEELAEKVKDRAISLGYKLTANKNGFF